MKSCHYETYHKSRPMAFRNTELDELTVTVAGIQNQTIPAPQIFSYLCSTLFTCASRRNTVAKTSTL